MKIMFFFILSFYYSLFSRQKASAANHPTGYWKATGPNRFIGRGTQVADLCRGFSKGIFPKCSFFFPEHFGKNPLENPLQTSATCVPLPINLFGPVAFQ